MDISVPSRFACLKIEGDEGRPNPDNQRKRLEKVANKKIVSKNLTTTGKQNQNATGRKQKVNKQHEKQWEDWKKKDSETVNDNFEHDLQSALLQSKLDFESKKTGVDKNKQSGSNNKKKKSKTMYLDEFLEGSDKKATEKETEEEEQGSEAFYEEILKLTKKEITKNKVEEKRKEREVNIEKIISLAQCQEKLKIERERNAELQRVLEETKDEVATVKGRNKMLCSILGHGEMRDKAEVLLELERLNLVKDELTEEVAHLHKLLEQERSKSATETQSKHKDKKRKKGDN